MDINDVIDKCAKIERLVADLYYIFMKQQADNADCSGLWRKTAQEEENHEQQFMLAKRISKSQEIKSKVSIDVLDSIINALNTLINKVNSEPPSHKESFRLAIAVEEKLAEVHLNCSCVFTDESMNRLFKSMMMCDNGHLDKLKQAYTAFDNN